MSSRIPLAALCTALLMALAVTTTAADARPKKLPQSEFRDFVLEKASAVHTVDWHWLDSEKLDDCTGYEESSGVQKVDVALDAPASHKLMIVGRSVALLPDELIKASGTISRTFDEKIQPPCAACGGELGECTGEQPKPPEREPYDCKTRRLVAPQIPIVLFRRGMEQPPEDGDDLLGPPEEGYVSVQLVSSADDYENCPPTHDLGPGLPDFDSIGVRFPNADLRRMLALKPGASMRLQGRRENGYLGALNATTDEFSWRDDCPNLKGPGLQVCDKLTVDVVLRRVKAPRG